MIEYFDRQGQQITPYQWQVLSKDKSYIEVRRNEGREYLILTIWLGIDHVNLNFDKSRLYKTILLKKIPNNSFIQCTLDFFKTEKDALAYHEILFSAVKEALEKSRKIL